MEVGLVTDACDKHLAGWAYWEFKNYKDLTTSAGTGSEGFYNADGSLQKHKVSALARSYVKYTQGLLTHMDYDIESKVLIASFTLNSDVNAPTVVYPAHDLGDDWEASVIIEGKTMSVTDAFDTFGTDGYNYFF